MGMGLINIPFPPPPGTMTEGELFPHVVKVKSVLVVSLMVIPCKGPFDQPPY